MTAPSTPITEQSWENTTYAGLPTWTFVKNTFIDCPAERSFSLEEFMQLNEQKCKSCPNSGVIGYQPSKLLQSQTILEESETSTTDGASTPPSAEEEKELEESWENITYGELPQWTAVKNTFIDCPAERSFSLEEFMQLNEHKCKSCPSSGIMMPPNSMPRQSLTIFENEGDYETIASSEETQRIAPGTEEAQTVVLNLAPMIQAQPIFSLGSHAHQFGQCMPCGFVHKPDGCTKGASCPFCHICPPGTMKDRKQMKKTVMKMRRMEAFAHRQQMMMGRRF